MLFCISFLRIQPLYLFTTFVRTNFMRLIGVENWKHRFLPQTFVLIFFVFDESTTFARKKNVSYKESLLKSRENSILFRVADVKFVRFETNTFVRSRRSLFFRFFDEADVARSGRLKFKIGDTCRIVRETKQ